jgi:8-oxo-dGTP pyrophosphatase MutT (NUDIX family)
VSLRDDTLAVLGDWAAPDPEQELVRRRFVDYLEGHDSGVLREDRPHHVTASTLVIAEDASAVLLTLHAKAHRWFQFGGHLEPQDGSLLDAAAREAREESGLDLALDPVPIELSDHEVPFCGEGVHHYDVRFLAVAPLDAVHNTSEESIEVRWWPADALPPGVDGPESDLVDLVDHARRRLELRRG